MPPNPKKKADKEKKKKKKVKANPKPSAETEKDIEIPDSTSPIEDQPTINVEAPSTGGPAPVLEKVNPSLQDPSDQVKIVFIFKALSNEHTFVVISKTLFYFVFDQDGNEGNATILVNDEDSLAQDVGTNNVEVTLAGKDKGPEIEEIPTNHPDSEKTISAHAAESTHSSENTDVEMESDNQDDSMPEATEGGSEILPVSSTSKLSADIGLSEMQFIAMKDSDPAAALRMLLSSKGNKEQSKGASHHSSSTASDTEINSTVRQDSLLLKLHTDYINQDVFALIEANPSSAFSHLGFLKKLHNPLTDGATLSKVIQLENLIDGFTQAIQRKKMNALKLEAQTHAHAALVEKAKTAQANVERLEKEIESNAEITECNDNITAWENEVAELNLKIQSLNAKIDAEKAKRDEAKANLSSAVKAKIDKEANEGIKFFSASAAVEEEIQNLVQSSKVLDKEVSSFKNLYEDLKKQF
jgi:hypothetical protein